MHDGAGGRVVDVGQLRQLARPGGAASARTGRPWPARCTARSGVENDGTEPRAGMPSSSRTASSAGMPSVDEERGDDRLGRAAGDLAQRRAELAASRPSAAARTRDDGVDAVVVDGLAAARRGTPPGVPVDADVDRRVVGQPQPLLEHGVGDQHAQRGRVADDRHPVARPAAAGGPAACATSNSSRHASRPGSRRPRRTAPPPTARAPRPTCRPGPGRRARAGRSSPRRSAWCGRRVRASRANLRGLPKLSRYSSTTSVAGSVSQYCSRSLPETSARLPAETKVDSPRPRPRRPLEHRDAERAGLAEEADPAAAGDQRREAWRSAAPSGRC